MINLFRNLLLNITAEEQIGSTVVETIPPEYFPRSYPSSFEIVRRILIGTGSISEQAYRAQFVLRLTLSSELSAYLEDKNNIYTFDPKNIKHFNKEFTFPLSFVDKQLTSLTQRPKFFSEVRKRVDNDTFAALRYIADYHDNAIWRVAAIAVMFLLGASTF